VVSPTVTATPTPTPTPDASVKPERPAAMDEVSAAGAEAVAVYFLQLFPYVYATGDLAEWRALSHPECIYCANVAAGVEEMFAAGQHSVGGHPDITEVNAAEVDPGRWWSVDVDLVQSPSQTLDGTDELVEEFPGSNFHMDIAVVFEGDHWVVRELSHERID
jgi:hypothetical protein